MTVEVLKGSSGPQIHKPPSSVSSDPPTLLYHCVLSLPPSKVSSAPPPRHSYTTAACCHYKHDRRGMKRVFRAANTYTTLQCQFCPRHSYTTAYCHYRHDRRGVKRVYRAPNTYACCHYRHDRRGMKRVFRAGKAYTTLQCQFCPPPPDTPLPLRVAITDMTEEV